MGIPSNVELGVELGKERDPGNGVRSIQFYNIQGLPTRTARRYSEFVYLLGDLRAAGLTSIPKLPPKRTFVWDSPAFVEERAKQLDIWVKSLTQQCPEVLNDAAFQDFVGFEQATADDAKKAGDIPSRPRLQVPTRVAVGGTAAQSSTNRHATFTSHRLIAKSQQDVDAVVHRFDHWKQHFDTVIPGWFETVEVTDGNNIGSQRICTYAAKRLNGGGKKRQETLVAKTEHSHTIRIDYGTFERSEEDLGLLPYGMCTHQTHSIITAQVSENQTLVSSFALLSVSTLAVD
jgi:hypothetical protein